ncbi:MAG: radical SAM protein [Pseudomonadota bacterium]
MKRHKPKFQLSEIKIEVTHNCRLRCVHCSSVAEENTGRSMGWLSCKQILDDAKAMGVKTVAFSGGEPLCWGHIQDAIERASKHGMEVFLYTTGNVPYAQKIMKHLKKGGLSHVMFSLFGVDAKQHEKVTATEGSYNKTIEIIAYCVNICLDTEIHFVPLSNNYKSLKIIAEQARKLGVKRISLLRMVPQGRGATEKDNQLSYSQNLELRKIITTLRADGYDIRLGSPYNFLMLRDKPQCRSGVDRLTVGPDLRIFPCDAFKHIPPKSLCVGEEFSNLSKNELQECWDRSPYLGIVRKYLSTDFSDTCKMCHKLKECLSGCMAQKFYAWGELRKSPDPMCLLSSS